MAKALRKRRKPSVPFIDAPAVARFIRDGGMLAREAKVAADAIAAERRFWLPVLQGWLRVRHLSPATAAFIGVEVKRLRRALGLPPTRTHLRELNRNRVRAYRERQRQGETQNKREGEQP